MDTFINSGIREWKPGSWHKSEPCVAHFSTRDPVQAIGDGQAATFCIHKVAPSDPLHVVTCHVFMYSNALAGSSRLNDNTTPGYTGISNVQEVRNVVSEVFHWPLQATGTISGPFV